MPWRGPSAGWPIKYVRMDPHKRHQFETLCKAMGVREYEIIDQVISKWIRENENQYRLTSYLVAPRQVTIFADKVEVTTERAILASVKSEFRVTLRILANPKLEEGFRSTQKTRLENALRRIRNVSHEARARDPELQHLVDQVEAQFG